MLQRHGYRGPDRRRTVTSGSRPPTAAVVVLGVTLGAIALGLGWWRSSVTARIDLDAALVASRSVTVALGVVFVLAARSHATATGATTSHRVSLAAGLLTAGAAVDLWSVPTTGTVWVATRTALHLAAAVWLVRTLTDPVIDTGFRPARAAATTLGGVVVATAALWACSR